MEFSYFKSNVINPEKQIIIDKKVTIQNKEYHFISLYEKDNNINLLALNIEDDIETDINPFYKSQTKREELLHGINQKHSNIMTIDKLYINNTELLHSSSSSTGSFKNFNDYLALNYIINLGIDLSYLDDLNLSNIGISLHEFHIASDDIFDYNNLKMYLSIAHHPNQKLINKEITLTFENQEDFFFLDNDKKEHFIARLIELDYWNKIITELLQNLKDKNIEINEEDYQKDFETICPKDMNLLCVAYKSTNQLNFYLKDSLNKPLNSSASSMTLYINDPDSDERYCLLKPIKKASIQSTTVELFSYYEKYTTELINIL